MELMTHGDLGNKKECVGLFLGYIESCIEATGTLCTAVYGVISGIALIKE